MPRNARLLILLALLSLSVLALEATRELTEKPGAPQMRAAAQRTQAAFAAIKGERERRGLPLNLSDDPNQTGMIGDEFTEITTTLGSLESKRSSTNPNVAAIVVDMFQALGIGEGERVAVNLSGSFPALNIAVICAMDELSIEGVLIASVGASTYGANLPSFTYLDMERFLYDAGLIRQRCTAFSMGGQDDLGLEMPEDVRAAIRARLTGLGYASIEVSDLEQNLVQRIALYESEGEVRCLVNVGGNLLSFGADGGMAQGGIIRGMPGGAQGGGLVGHYLSKGVPVMHLLNMKGLTADYGLPFDPSPMPEIGSGGVYHELGYNKNLLAILIVLNLAALLGLFARPRGPSRIKA